MSRPGRVIELREGLARVEVEGRSAWFNALLVPEVKPGAWVLTHTSLVVAEISEKEADAVSALIREGTKAAQ